MYGVKLLWVGLTMILALVPGLALLGINVDEVIVQLGGLVMFCGCVLYLFDR